MYGANSALRAGISALGLNYVAAIVATLKVRGASDDIARQPRLSVKQLALSLPKHAWRTITWHEGTNSALRSRFARVRVHASPTRGRRGRPEETLLIEWPKGEPEPTKYWLATHNKNILLRALVDLAQMDFGHYEGRGWPGFHHHGTLCIAAYGFLISERELIPPSRPHSARRVKKPAISNGYRPRGTADPAPTPRCPLDYDPPPSLHLHIQKSPPKVSILSQPIQKKHAAQVMTQYQ